MRWKFYKVTWNGPGRQPYNVPGDPHGPYVFEGTGTALNLPLTSDVVADLSTFFVVHCSACGMRDIQRKSGQRWCWACGKEDVLEVTPAYSIGRGRQAHTETERESLAGIHAFHEKQARLDAAEVEELQEFSVTAEHFGSKALAYYVSPWLPLTEPGVLDALRNLMGRVPTAQLVLKEIEDRIDARRALEDQGWQFERRGAEYQTLVPSAGGRPRDLDQDLIRALYRNGVNRWHWRGNTRDIRAQLQKTLLNSYDRKIPDRVIRRAVETELRWRREK